LQIFGDAVTMMQTLDHPYGGDSMKLLPFGILLFALSFCGIGERLRRAGSSNTSSGNSNSGSTKSTSGDTGAEKPSLTGTQQAIQDSATEVQWPDQGISWKLPAGWPKMDVKKGIVQLRIACQRISYRLDLDLCPTAFLRTSASTRPTDSALGAAKNRANTKRFDGWTSTA
jgi:hypothetical protein